MTTRAPAVLLACLALAACGGDEDASSDEFLSQANAICADYGPKIAAIPPPVEDLDEWAAIAADMSDQLEASVNELRLLEPPGDLADGFGDWIGIRSEILAAMRGVQDAATIHDEPAIETGLATVAEKQDEADALAGELGLADCSPTGITLE
jgi:hypothetical protein